MNPSLLLIPDRYKAAKLYSQIPDTGDGDLTFARNSNATRVNSQGLIEKVRTNVALYSEQFNDAAWTKTNLSVSANSIANPVNGAMTADTIVEAATTGAHIIFQSPGLTGSFTYTVFAKAKERDHIAIAGAINPTDFYSALFDLTSGTVQQTANGLNTGLTASIVAVGSGWYRCSVALSSAIAIPFVIWTSDGATLTPLYFEPTYAGDGTSGVYVFGAQAETGDIATDYIPTTTAAVSVGITADIPRLDYTGGGCPSLLLEPQRTNSAQFSEQFDDAYWNKITSSVTANTTISPDGFTNADTISFTASATSRCERGIAGAFESQSHTVSVYAKVASGTGTFRLKCTHSSVDDYFSSDLVATTQWQRFTFTQAFSASVGSGINFGIINGTNALAKDIIFYGFQTEINASYPTSYIPTLGSSVTRLADTASKTGISSLIGQTEGTLFIDVVPTDLSSLARYISIEASAGVGSGWIGIFTDGLGDFRFYGDGWDFSAGSIVRGTRYKVAMAYKNGVLTSAYINGVSVGTLTANTTSKSYATLKLANASIGNFGCSDFFSSAIFPIALSNSELAILTAL
jgi:hypothetical protein